MADNLAGASRASQFQNQIDQLGSLGTSVDEFEFNLTALESIVGKFIEETKERIESADMIVTGAIEDLRMAFEGDHIYIYGNEHLIYQDKGVRGAESSALAPDSPHAYSDKMPPVEVFREYIKRSNMNLRNNEFLYGEPSKFEELTDDQLIDKVAWGMAKNIQKNGFKPRNLFTKFIPDLIDELKVATASNVKATLVSLIRNKHGHDVMNKPK
ncbi:hypothetical protein [Pedobacter sp. CFBP9032]|uniref:hypothetical protein n=1 Tax=Pedobacter sp. CFBP9032 TaxID=3096539 RepID=UPI002A6A9A94|nr:hypothetical protein [Pedobacter sp. CFBP9032]MDY0906580.1 hypothetical protein [Pedobacter sp. CFBP9032]